ncbi:hypothetical protein D9619_007670 [Psilocybe cf. subviscida]|uniref:Uncharacterized protein n=1 Tax=Psilocybe cf. subviscida TaxID=2480587 RepID=A0A8H5AU91_9AGAR|nr:hypothetical protein D9619_007670 [Psilocybe cf. subviscida]
MVRESRREAYCNILGDRAERWGAFVMPGLDRVDLEDELRVLDGCANLHAMRRSAPHGVIPAVSPIYDNLYSNVSFFALIKSLSSTPPIELSPECELIEGD